MHSFPTRRSSDLYPAVPGSKNPYVDGVKALYQEACVYISKKKNADKVVIAMGHLHAQKASVSDMDSQERLRSEEHTSELQSRGHIVCRLLLEKIKLIHPDRTINELAGKYDRMDRFDCRKVLAKEVYYKAFMIEILPHIHSGGHSQRSDAVVQP